MCRYKCLFLIPFFVTVGCMDPLYDYDECVQIETARCDLREACKTIAPDHMAQEFPNFDRKTCIVYAKENCRVRRIEKEDWVQPDVDRCETAIRAVDCQTLSKRNNEAAPNRLPECWFLEDEEEIDTSTETDTIDGGPDDAGSDSG